MSRIRTIKPEFWSSAQVMECSPIARLMFIGIWNFCDDEGRHVFSPKTVKAQVFPGDDLAIEDVLRMLNELSTNGLIVVYEHSGREFMQITGWRHQRVDKPRKSVFPGPLDEGSTITHGTFAPDLILSYGNGSYREGSSNIPGKEKGKSNSNGHGHYVRWDTAQWNAWEDYYRKAYKKSPPKDLKGGWLFPTEWPPDTPTQ